MSTIDVTLNRVGSTNQFTGTYSEGAPSGNPTSITRDFKCTLSTGSTIDNMSDAECSVKDDANGQPLPHTETEPVYNTVQKTFLISTDVNRPTGGWPTTIDFDFSVQVTFGS